MRVIIKPGLGAPIDKEIGKDKGIKMVFPNPPSTMRVTLVYDNRRPVVVIFFNEEDSEKVGK